MRKNGKEKEIFNKSRPFFTFHYRGGSHQNEIEKTAVASQLQHLDIMCQTLERQIDVLSLVHRVIPSNHGESIQVNPFPSSVHFAFTREN